METDSDSDDSHISATPPRNPPKRSPPLDPPPPPPLPPPPTLISSHKSRVRVSSLPNPIPKPTHSPRRKPLKDKPENKPKNQSDPSPSIDSSYLHGFSLKIHRRSENKAVPALDSTEILPAGYFSKSGSFSSSFKTRKLSFDPVEIEMPEVAAEDVGNHVDRSQSDHAGDRKRVLRKHPNSIGAAVIVDSSRSDHVGDRERVLRKHPNSIGAAVIVNPLPVKKMKCASEGNFVRLNINGYGRKFAKKGGKSRTFSSSSSLRKSFRRNRKSVSKSEIESGAGICDEEGLVSDTTKRPKDLKFSCELIEEAVIAAREDPSDENLKNLLKMTHGYDSFRNGQLAAIQQVLAGQSTMLVLPTGAGKSLCYQLPALILGGITLVVSPLVALMVDQLRRLPPMIQGGLLSSSQTFEEASETLHMLREGSIKVLFVSPERLLNAEFLSIFESVPLISLVVIDEAHCLSEWSHNFRPSYLRLKASLLRTKLNVECVLAMTATATTQTLHAVMQSLEIPCPNLIQASQVRENLQLSVTLSGNRMKDLIMLMKSSPLSEVKSIIVYCKFQSETDLLSKYLRDNNISAKSYHSSISAKDRSRVQELFCSNKIRVVVATVAFGMGLDKSDVGAVIHYSLPESLEEYVQETGRAGRDGRLSYCHLLLDDITYFKLRSLSYSDGVDEYVVNRFLCQVFNNSMNLLGNICSLVKEAASRKFDMKEEVMLTVLTYLELCEEKYLRVLPQLNVTCTMNFHKTSPGLLACKEIVVAMILKKSETRQGAYVFDIPTIANCIHITTTDLFNRLQTLKSLGEVTYELKDPAFCYKIVRNPEDLCSLTTHLTRWLSDVECCKVRKLDAMFSAATFAAKDCPKNDGCCNSLHTPCLQRKILGYFSSNHDASQCDFTNNIGRSSPYLRADVKVFLQGNSHAKFTPRAVARIMHGISSPAFPSATWSKTHFWGRYSQIDFPVVMEAATAELMNFVGKSAL